MKNIHNLNYFLHNLTPLQLQILVGDSCILHFTNFSDLKAGFWQDKVIYTAKTIKNKKIVRVEIRLSVEEFNNNYSIFTEVVTV